MNRLDRYQKGNSAEPIDFAFETHVSDDWFEPVGAGKLVRSLKYFHPEIPIIIFPTKAIESAFKSGRNWFTLTPYLCKQVALYHDIVCHIDADSVVVGKLDELLTFDYEIAGVRNNNDSGGAGKGGPFLRDKEPANPNITVELFLNAGLVASSKLGFWTEWDFLNNVYAQFYGTGEQVVLNDVAYSGEYKLRILDPIEASVYYGVSSLSGTKTHWDSWQEVELIDNKLMLNNKQIKVLHHAGGHKIPKLQFEELFKPEVAAWLNKITS